MILIAHRGNTRGREPEKENSPSHIEAALSNGYDVEVDIRMIGGALHLGHDKPDHHVSLSWLESIKPKAWIHCKDFESLQCMHGSDFNYFWHDIDHYTITSHGHIWVYPGRVFDENCVVVMPETWDKSKRFNCKGLCSDKVNLFKKS